MSCMKCCICGERYWNDNETVISVNRIERDERTCAVKTIVWRGAVCDSCLKEHLGIIKEAVSGE